jgi:ABC-type bacteriocin/lantibiotic exporter with double-glycine peptidase domain
MSMFETKKPNLDAVAGLLLKKLNVNANAETIEDKLHAHPEYPSILALSDCLTELNVANQAFRLTKENYKSEDLIFPFVAHFNDNRGNFVLINSIENGFVKIMP